MDTATGVIGIIGGVGPLAGLDLAAKIMANTRAGRDQDHLPLILASLPELIPDRSAYLLSKRGPNPAEGLIEAAKRLKAAGASLVCIPCNTAHAGEIFGPFQAESERLGLEVVNMLEETAAQMLRLRLRKACVLSTLGTYESGVYTNYLHGDDIEIIDPGPELMGRVHEAIYHPEYGIKCRPGRNYAEAGRILEDALAHCRCCGAEAAVLGCTELPLVFAGEEAGGLRLVDPATSLARALIRRVAPDRLAED